MPSIEDLNHPDLRVRIETAQALIDAGALTEIISAFNHAELEVRWRAAAAAGRMGMKAVIPGLVDLSRGAVYEIKFNCIWALGHIGETSVVPYLLEILHAGDDESPDIRYNAALALARLGQSSALQDALSDASHPAYRVAHAALGASHYF